MSFARFLCLCAALTGLVFAAADPKPAPDARFGNVLYRTPPSPQWKIQSLPDRRVFSADVPAPDYCRITVFAGGPLAGDFRPAFEEAIQAALREARSDRIERDSGLQASQAAEGFDVLQRTLGTGGAGGTGFHWFLGAHSGDRFDLIAFQASSEALFQREGAAAANFFYSVKLANSLPTSAPVAEPTAARPQTPAAPTSARAALGPLKVGDAVEVPWAGGWVPGIVMNVQGLTYFVHFGAESDEGKNDDFFTLNLIRPPGGPRTYAEMFHEVQPSPGGGEPGLGAEVEFENGPWVPARIARRLGDRYVIFTDKPGYVTERWLTPDKLRLKGSTRPLGAAPAPQRRPTDAQDIHPGDLVDAHPRRGFWGPLTVLAQNGASYFVKIGPDSGLSMRGWVDLSHMRPVGAKDPFSPEDLKFFIGQWRLTGDSFQNLVGRTVSGGKVTETYQNNSGAGQNAGGIEIRANGTYALRRTVVYHDGEGRWERNPNQDEGGILLRGADGKGDKDCLMTNHQDGYGYLQGSIRGPGKWCTRVGP
jgi:hypothetical protein